MKIPLGKQQESPPRKAKTQLRRCKDATCPLHCSASAPDKWAGLTYKTLYIYLAMYTMDRCLRRRGSSSRMAATVGSHMPTMEDIASRHSMRKKRKLKSGGSGMVVIASG